MRGPRLARRPVNDASANRTEKIATSQPAELRLMTASALVRSEWRTIGTMSTAEPTATTEKQIPMASKPSVRRAYPTRRRRYRATPTPYAT